MSDTAQPTPCKNRNCREGHVAEERVAMAAALCKQRGVQLTASRQRVLELLWENHNPMGAYDLIDALRSESNKSVAPPTVYRALDFLMAQGLVSKIESKNAYIPCVHPERNHDCLFLICSQCGDTTEIEDSHIAKRLTQDAAEFGFSVTRHTIEVVGVCGQCNQQAVSGPVIS